MAKGANQRDVAAGRLTAEGLHRRLRRPPFAIEPASGCGRGRALLLLRRRAVHDRLPDRHRHPGCSSARSRTGNPHGSAETIFRENIMGGMCARVCPTETLCEAVCVRNTGRGQAYRDRPVAALCHRRADGDRAPAVRARPSYRQTHCRRRRRPGRPRLRPPHRRARPRGHHLRGQGEARRAQRVRHRRLQDDRRFRPTRGRIHPRHRRHRRRVRQRRWAMG